MISEKQHIDDINKFYNLITVLTQKLDGEKKLCECHGRLGWPQRGVYFFMEHGENRSDSGNGPRIVRVGTHAVRPSMVTLWKRLSQHRGTQKSEGGNHRGSIFREIVGAALIKRDNIECATWLEKKKPVRNEDREREAEIERKVSAVIGQMPFVWISIDDEPGTESMRAYIERNAIGLLSNYHRKPVDKPSSNWLGNNCGTDKVRESGLWNSNHVQEYYNPEFLSFFENIIEKEKGIL